MQPVLSEEEIALNRAIFESLQQPQPMRLLQPTQPTPQIGFITPPPIMLQQATAPRQTVTTIPRVPIPVQTVPRPFVPVPAVTRPPIPVPVVTRPSVPAPRQGIPQVPPLATIHQEPIPVLRSPGRMSPDEEEQMRLAIMASLEEQYEPIADAATIVRSPPRGPNPLLSPIETDEEVEEAFLQEAIEASIRAAEEAKLATLHANRLTAPLTTEMQRLQADRALREQQNREYEETLRIDEERAENARRAAEAATRAAEAAEEATRKLAEAQMAEELRRTALQPPVLVYPLETADTGDIYLIRFKLPSGAVVNHSFHRDEPLSSILQQLRFDLKYFGDLILTIQQPRMVVTCSPVTPISNCGFGNRIMVLVTYP